MKLKAIALALGLISSSAFAGMVIQIDPDGAAGADGVQNVLSLGWNNGNSISLPTDFGSVINPTDPTAGPTGIIQTYGQGSLGTFNNAGGAISGLGLNSAYEWTYVFGAQENAITTTNMFGISTAYFQTVAGGDNFFSVYYGPKDSSDVNGTGFTNGTLVMSGTIRADGPGKLAGSFTRTDPALVALDLNGDNNYAGVLSTQGTGSTKLTADLSYVNSDFVKTAFNQMVITLDTFNSQPFDKVDPSSCFTDGAGNPVNGAGPNNAGGTCARAIGAINGESGSAIMFQTRATVDFNYVPEPGSMALAGAGLLSLLGLRRKRA